MLPQTIDILAYRLALATQAMLQKAGHDMPLSECYDDALWQIENPDDRAFYAEDPRHQRAFDKTILVK